MPVFTAAELADARIEQEARQREARRRALPELAEARATIERMEGRPIEPARGAPDLVVEG